MQLPLAQAPLPLERTQTFGPATRLTNPAPPTDLEAARDNLASSQQGPDELRKWFNRAVGQTFFRQMISEMRKGLQPSAYFHGGRGEEVFQKELDQIMAEKMAEASGDKFAGPMFDLFELQSNTSRDENGAFEADSPNAELFRLQRR